MKQTITESYFIDQIVGDEYNNMTYEGAKALFGYFEQLEEAGALLMPNGTITEIRDEITEYENLKELLKTYNSPNAPVFFTIADFQDSTQVIEIPNSDRIIIENF